MSRIEGTIIFTDLDGTLLDHDTYSFEPAKPVIEHLLSKNVPIIPVTSKTKAELLSLRERIGLNGPFVIENGAAIYTPKGYFQFNDDSLVDAGDYWCKRFAPDRSALIEILDNAPDTVRQNMRCFHDLSVEELSEITGLSLEQASLAAQREFSEPIEWLGEEGDLAELSDYARQHGYDLVKGGRFYHLTNGYDKGQALYWLKQQFMRENPKQSQFAIALGDSPNDFDMLEAADQAILIKNYKAVSLDLNPDLPLIRSTVAGPEGWASALTSFLNLNISR